MIGIAGSLLMIRKTREVVITSFAYQVPVVFLDQRKVDWSSSKFNVAAALLAIRLVKKAVAFMKQQLKRKLPV